MYTRDYSEDFVRNANYDVLVHVEDFVPSFSAIALDLGCGTCRKLPPLSRRMGRYFGIDVSRDMVLAANKYLSSRRIQNISAHVGNNNYLPFDPHSVDVVTCFLSVFNLEEIKRVLNDQGVFILETLGAGDKRELKSMFGRDALGFRGLYMNQSNDERIRAVRSQLERYFKHVSLKIVSFETTLPLRGLQRVLEMTPTIRDFGSAEDYDLLRSVSSASGEVSFVEQRILARASDRRLDV